VNTRPS
jgi:hypothetical protein